MKIERFEITNGSMIEACCSDARDFKNNVIALDTRDGKTELYLNVDTGSSNKNKFNIVELPTNSRSNIALTMNNFFGTVVVNGVARHYFVVTNEEYLMYFNK